MPSTLRFSTLDLVQNMDCDRVTRALYLARQGLEEWEVQALDAHLAACAQCSRRAAYTAEMLEVIQRQAPRTSAPDRLRLRILQSFQHRRVASGRAGRSDRASGQ